MGKTYNGNLRINREAEYIIGNGEANDLSKDLNELLTDKIKIKITDLHSGKILLKQEGILYKKKIDGSLWLFHIDNYNVDNLLWEVSSKEFNKIRIEIEIINNKVKYEK